MSRGRWMVAGLASRGRRLVAAAVAVVIGVGFLVASLVVLSTVRDGVEQVAAPGYAAADLVASYPAPAAVRAIRGLDEVEVSAVDVQTYLEGTGESAVVGATMPRGGAATLLSGRVPSAPEEVALGSTLAGAREIGVGVGDTLPVDGRDLDVVGLLDLSAEPMLSWQDAFVTTEATLLGLSTEPTYEAVLLHLRGGADQAQALAALEQVAPDALVQEGSVAAQERVDGMTGGPVLASVLLGFGAVALVTAVIVIANTFTIVLTQRTTELAMLRCVGATRGQVRRQRGPPGSRPWRPCDRTRHCPAPGPVEPGWFAWPWRCCWSAAGWAP